MRRVRALFVTCFALLALAALALLGVRARYGGGGDFPDRSAAPELPAAALETVASLDFPPGSVAVSAKGRVFASFHPEGRPPFEVFELKDGKPEPYPPGGLPGGLAYQTVRGLHVDARNRLWVLDQGRSGLGTARLLAFDLATDALVHRHDFPRKIALLGSSLADLAITPDGHRVYVADASYWLQVPAVIDYDVSRQASRRLLQGHESVLPEPFVPVVQGVRMEVFGLFALRPGVGSLALDPRGDWLYFAPATSRWLYRLHRRDLDDASLARRPLESRVERYAEKTMSDGIAVDADGTVYLADPEHSAIVALDSDRKLHTLVRDERLRWPEGLALGPDGRLYVGCSALHQVLGKSPEEVAAHAPYPIFRFAPRPDGAAAR